MAIDHVVLTDGDSAEIPPRKVIRLHGHPSSPGHPEVGVSIEFCEADEDMTEIQYTILESFYVPADQLRAALALVLGEDS